MNGLRESTATEGAHVIFFFFFFLAMLWPLGLPGRGNLLQCVKSNVLQGLCRKADVNQHALLHQLMREKLGVFPSYVERNEEDLHPTPLRVPAAFQAEPARLSGSRSRVVAGPLRSRSSRVTRLTSPQVGRLLRSTALCSRLPRRFNHEELATLTSRWQPARPVLYPGQAPCFSSFTQSGRTAPCGIRRPGFQRGADGFVLSVIPASAGRRSAL